jgi:hypothetical protein
VRPIRTGRSPRRGPCRTGEPPTSKITTGLSRLSSWLAEESELAANLVAHPVVRLQDGAVIREFRAREVAGEEKTYFWAVAECFWPHFPEYR